MYATFKIEENDCRLATIVLNGKVYKVPNHYNITLHGVKCCNKNVDFLDFVESVKRTVDFQPSETEKNVQRNI